MRNHPARGWIRGNTKIGPVLDVAVSYPQGRYGVEVMINSPVGDRTRSWVRIVNGKNKYVTEMSKETHIEDMEREYGVGVTAVQGANETPCSIASMCCRPDRLAVLSSPTGYQRRCGKWPSDHCGFWGELLRRLRIAVW